MCHKKLIVSHGEFIEAEDITLLLEKHGFDCKKPIDIKKQISPDLEVQLRITQEQ